MPEKVGFPILKPVSDTAKDGEPIVSELDAQMVFFPERHTSLQDDTKEG